MTDHLPECEFTDEAHWPEPAGICICAPLRACEQRVLDAARAAVDAEPKEDGGYCHVVHVCDALAAIDALKEKP